MVTLLPAQIFCIGKAVIFKIYGITLRSANARFIKSITYHWGLQHQCFNITVYNRVQVDCTYKSTPKFSPQSEEKMQHPRISRPLFSGLIWKFILWHATKRSWDRSVDGPFPPAVFSDLTRLPPSVFGRPTIRLLFSWPYCRTAVWIMIKIILMIIPVYSPVSMSSL